MSAASRFHGSAPHDLAPGSARPIHLTDDPQAEAAWTASSRSYRDSLAFLAENDASPDAGSSRAVAARLSCAAAELRHAADLLEHHT